MDNVDSILAGVGSGGVIGLIYIVWKMFKHSRCRSHCCGKEASMSVDLEEGFGIKKEIPKQEVNASPPNPAV